MSSPKSAATKDARKPQNAGKKSQTAKPEIEVIKAEIVSWISSGKFLTQFCEKFGLGRTTVYDWMQKDPVFAEQVARAREDGQEVFFEQAATIADEAPPADMNGRTDSGYVAWQKNRIWARLEMLKRMNPAKYGDKVNLNHEGGVTLNVVTGVSDDD